MNRKFHLGDILSITTERLVSPRHMEGIYDILNYMTNDDLFTHQLPRASNECKPHLLEQMPWLKEIDGNEVTTENWEEWLRERVDKYGMMHVVEPVPSEAHERIGPFTEAMSLVKPSTVIIPVIVGESNDM